MHDMHAHTTTPFLTTVITPQIVAWIPKNACLTRVTSMLVSHVAGKGKRKTLAGIPQNTLLIMCLIHERSIGAKSR